MFNKLFATLIKDILLLWRDRAGLLVLFVMPAVLVVIITMVQNNVYRLMGEAPGAVILVDLDNGELGQRITERLAGVKMVSTIAGEKISPQQAATLVGGGDYQLGIIVREGTVAGFVAKAEAEVYSSLSAEYSGQELVDVPQLEIIFDPAVMGGFRATMHNSLAMVLSEFEIQHKLKILSRLLPEFVREEIKKSAGDFADYIELPQLDIKMSSDSLLSVRTTSSPAGSPALIPTPVQHNVPAWALFGMFFIVIPMAGSLIKERQEETLSRLMVMPVSYVVVLAGKIAAYLLICCAQFTLIFLIGRFLLPHLGLEPFHLGANLAAVSLVVLAASLAACCYGIMLGTVCKTYEQASMFGSISVVCAAALGGVMVPVYAMPEIMQKISVISPLGWGLEAFLDILVRGGNFPAVLDELYLLIMFALATSFVAWLIFSRRNSLGS